MSRLGRLGREVRPSISAHLELGDGGGAVVVRAEGLKLLVELVVRCHRRQVALGVERRDVSHSVTAAPCAAAAAWAAEGVLLWRARSSPGPTPCVLGGGAARCVAPETALALNVRGAPSSIARPRRELRW